MTIRIPSKSDKLRSQLVDALRIISYKDFKLANKDSELQGLEFYELFAEEWNEHPIHDLNMKELKELIDGLEYSEEELINLRTEYYEQRQRYLDSH
jgi:hypothetical protein